MKCQASGLLVFGTGWHYDAIPEQFLTSRADQRVATLLVYCNEVHDGGRTVFRDLLAPGKSGSPTQLQVQPRRGRALLFFPTDANGLPDERTLHAGEPAETAKWIAQLWVHPGQYFAEVPSGTCKLQGAQSARSYARRNSLPAEHL